jgi:hypothetical protein
MIRILLSVLLVAFITGATAQKKMTPLELNNYFTSINDTLYTGGTKWGAELNKARSSKDFSGLTAHRKGLQSFAKRKLKELQNMQDIKGSEELRVAMINLLKMEIQMMADAFMPFEKLNNSSTSEEIQDKIDNLVEVAKQEGEILNKIRVAQKSYAHKNGFTIEGEDE